MTFNSVHAPTEGRKDAAPTRIVLKTQFASHLSL